MTNAGHMAAAVPHHVSNHVKNLQWLSNWHLSLISVRQDWCSSAQTDSYPLYIRLEPLFSPDTGVNNSTYHFSTVEQPDTLLIGFWAVKKWTMGHFWKLHCGRNYILMMNSTKNKAATPGWSVCTELWLSFIISDLGQELLNVKFYTTSIELPVAMTALGFVMYTQLTENFIQT